jgi:hypothetical protein
VKTDKKKSKIIFNSEIKAAAPNQHNLAPEENPPHRGAVLA